MQYLIFFTQRCGSSWLASLLETSGLGPCREFHKDDDIEEFSDCAGIKVAYGAIDVLASQVNFLDYKIIRMNRKDRLRQAISMYRADITQKWSVFDESNSPEPEFNAEEILKRKKWLDDYDRRWNELLVGVPHLNLWYEDLLEDSASVLERIAVFLEKEIIGEPKTFFEVQRDELTEEFYRKLVDIF